ncbi:MAG: hypothetical protein IIB94_01610 [Candidatus Marinimicrobia bacterium]|nr:hypothetical protein [Candidatus Neomarinimicrobiota bacterium]
MASELKELDEIIRAHLNPRQFKEQENIFLDFSILEENEVWDTTKQAELEIGVPTKVELAVSDQEIINHISNYRPSLEHRYLSQLASSIVFASYTEVESDISSYEIELFNKIKILELNNKNLEERVDSLESIISKLQRSKTEQKGFGRSTRESTNIKKLMNSAFKKLLNSDILSFITELNISEQMLQTIDIINETFKNNIAIDAHLSIDPIDGSGWVTLELLYGNNLRESEEQFELFLEKFIDKIPTWAQSLICVIVDPRN